MENALKLLAKRALIPLGLAAAPATDLGIPKNVLYLGRQH